MEVAQHIVLLLHLIGFASLFGGFLVQMKQVEPEVNAAMLHGSYTMLVTGVALVVFAEVGPDPVNHVKIGIKLVLALIITVLVVLNRRFTTIPRGLWGLLGLLTVTNAALAVLWQ
ncbi:hypothetical protein [Microlunatus soli]|nr:hypothetical protein [Microlunatus soli]